MTTSGALDGNKIESVVFPSDSKIVEEILDDIIENVVTEVCSDLPAPVKPPPWRRLKHQLSQDLTVPRVGWSQTAKLAVLVTILACCSNVVFLELLVIQDPGIGNLLTFSQFLVISIEGFVFTTKFGTLRPQVPFGAWLVLVMMYFLVNVINNYALSYNIPMPLHMVFRAGSLLVNMLMGIFILGKKYDRMKYLSVLMISLGILICTVMSATNRVSIKTGKVIFYNDTEVVEILEEDGLHLEDVKQLLCGVTLLTVSLFLSARMGIYQEHLFTRYGKHAKEALFYTHALPLPLFTFLAQDIVKHWRVCMASTGILIPMLDISVPVMVLHLAANVVLQYVCIFSVFVLTTECTSLTASLVLTTRKFISLLFSIWYFTNPFTPLHWAGTGLVFAGILLFSDIPGYLETHRNLRRKKQL